MQNYKFVLLRKKQMLVLKKKIKENTCNNLTKKRRKINLSSQLGEMVRVLVGHRDRGLLKTFRSALDPSTFVFHDPAVGPWSGNGVLGSVSESGA